MVGFKSLISKIGSKIKEERQEINLGLKKSRERASQVSRMNIEKQRNILKERLSFEKEKLSLEKERLKIESLRQQIARAKEKSKPKTKDPFSFGGQFKF